MNFQAIRDCKVCKADTLHWDWEYNNMGKRVWTLRESNNGYHVCYPSRPSLDHIEMVINGKSYFWKGEYRKPRLGETILTDSQVYTVQTKNMKCDGRSSESWFGIRAILYPMEVQEQPYYY